MTYATTNLGPFLMRRCGIHGHETHILVGFFSLSSFFRMLFVYIFFAHGTLLLLAL